MKIIDLLNIWVNDRDKLPKKIKVDNKIFNYHECGNLYVTYDKSCFLIADYLDSIEKLNREVEVIEENKEIEELIHPENWRANDNDIKNIVYKLNELAREVNKINIKLLEE